MGEKISVAQRVAAIAAEFPDRDALVLPARDGTAARVTYRGLDRRANHCAAVLAGHGVRASSTVVIALPNGLPHVVATLAAWKLGATVVVLDPRSPARETEETVAAADPALFVGLPRHDPPCPRLAPDAWGDGELAGAPPPAPVPPRSALATSGTTGRPRIILRRRGWLVDTAALPTAHERDMGLDLDQCQLVTTPLHHMGFGALHQGLALRHTVVLMPMFVPRTVADAIERYSVQVLRLVPTMMKLLLELDDLAARDLSSVVALHHGTGPCPPEVKRAWLALVGAENVYEGYSSQEQLAYVWIRGDEWLDHPGSVGRPAPGTVVVVGEDGRQAPPGRVGELYARPATGGQPEYLGPGPELPVWGDGYLSVGDLGHLDERGYLFVAGRAGDTINVGGAKVNPADVEDVLTAHPGVLDACVVPRPHPVRGQVPHAYVVAARPGLAPAELDAHCRGHLSPHKVPAAFELVDALPRTELGKLRRARLRAEWDRPA
jgi:bile acid-coenzyme A ligase